MDWTDRLIRIRQDLERLVRFPTVSKILSNYFWVAYEHLEQCAPTAQKLAVAFEAVLAYELWHHQAMSKLAESRELQMRYLVPLGVELRTSLQRLLHQLERLTAISPEEVVVRELLKAHCYQQLGDLEATLHSLREAIHHGATRPLLYFLSGYNRYRFALTKHAHWEPAERKMIVTDREAFEQALRQALEDFRLGLGSEGPNPVEAYLYFWMGVVHEMLGEEEEAAAAYQRARDLDPEAFGEDVHRFLQSVHQQQSSSRPSSLPSELQEEQMPIKPISEAELESLRRTLSEVETVSDLFRRMGWSPQEPTQGN